MSFKNSILFILLSAILGFGIGIIVVTRGEIFPPHVKEVHKIILKGDISPFRVVAEEVLPSVVNISSSRIVRQAIPFPFDFALPFNNFERKGVPFIERKVFSLGSGLIITEDGYILTNYHVIAGADEIMVTLNDGRTYKNSSVRFIGGDPYTDIAVIKINGSDFKKANLGNSDSIFVGDWAIAIGSPFGLSGTVTVGVISAKARNAVVNIEGDVYGHFIQTDASINPGNSGGPLCNVKGEVVGINTAIKTVSGGNIGIGFAIPINLAKQIAAKLMKYGKLERVFTGLKVEELTGDSKSDDSLGVLVSYVIEDSPAYKAGIRVGDIILSINEYRVHSVYEYQEYLREYRPGERIELTILRGEKRLNLSLRLTKVAS